MIFITKHGASVLVLTFPISAELEGGEQRRVTDGDLLCLPSPKVHYTTSGHQVKWNMNYSIIIYTQVNVRGL